MLVLQEEDHDSLSSWNFSGYILLVTHSVDLVRRKRLETGDRLEEGKRLEKGERLEEGKRLEKGERLAKRERGERK